jgi:hypothetical protein
LSLAAISSPAASGNDRSEEVLKNSSGTAIADNHLFWQGGKIVADGANKYGPYEDGKGTHRRRGGDQKVSHSQYRRLAPLQGMQARRLTDEGFLNRMAAVISWSLDHDPQFVGWFPLRLGSSNTGGSPGTLL